MRTIFLLFICICSNSFAQVKETDSIKQNKFLMEYENAKGKWDALIDKHIKVSMDTNYVSRPNAPWTIRLKTDIYGNTLKLTNLTKVHDIHTICKSTVGITANYRGLSLSMSINSNKLFKKNSDIEYNINYYGNKFGADFQLSRVNSFKQTIGTKKVDMDDTYMEGISVNAYYVFNNRKFSYPAAFTHSWIQRRSAGSLLFSITGYAQRTHIGYTDDFPAIDGNQLSEIRNSFAAVGAGYAYNFIPADGHWLVHLSAIPSITVWKYDNLYFGDTKVQSTNQPFNFYMTGRVGTTYYWNHNRYFLGITGIVQLYKPDKVDDIKIELLKFKGRAYFGFRF